MSKPVRVLFVLRPTSGGIRQHVLTLLQNMPNDRVEVLVACPPDDPGVAPIDLPGVRVFRLDICGEMSPVHDWRTAGAIARLAVTEKVDVIHAHSFKAGLLCMRASHMGRRAFSVVCTFHNPLRRHKNPLKDWLSRAIVARVGHAMDRVVVISCALEDEAVHLLGLPRPKLTQIYNGITMGPFEDGTGGPQFRAQLGLSEDTPVVLAVARLIPQKGIQYLIAASQLLREDRPAVKYVVVGDGPYRAELEALAHEKGVDNSFIFAGFRTDMPAALAAADLVCLPTLEEGLSISAIESMAAGKPVVASQVGGLPEIIVPGTGLLVPPANPGTLAEAIHALLSDRALRVRLGENGRRRVREGFAAALMAERHCSLYEELAKRSQT